jgi:carboxypeptidase Taq
MNNDFLAFQPTLEKIVEYLRKFVKYFETDTLKGYDVLLDMYEEGMGINEYDAFFNKLREDLVPFVLEVTKNKPIKFSRKLTHSVFPSEQQR